MRSLDWQDDAACRFGDATAFTTDTKPDPAEMTRLGLTCAGCTCFIQCGQSGLESTATGVYAGIYLPAIGQGRHLAIAALARKVGAA